MDGWCFEKKGSCVCLVLDIHDRRVRNFVGANTRVGWAREGGERSFGLYLKGKESWGRLQNQMSRDNNRKYIVMIFVDIASELNPNFKSQGTYQNALYSVEGMVSMHCSPILKKIKKNNLSISLNPSMMAIQTKFTSSSS